MNREKIKSVLLQALKEAGSLIRASLNERDVVEKKSELSIVTATDKKAEDTIIGLIRDEFPDHAILAEESLASGESPYRWIIDPLDGTTNFAHTYPVCCVSIAYEENGQVEVGGIYDPFRDELFFAERGQGATMNDQKIAVSETDSLSESILATGFPYDRRNDPDSYLSIVKAFMMTAQGIRRTGSAAIDLCYVACGRFDGYWEAKLNAWDVAAASLILSEAGGRLSNYAGGEFDIEGSQTVGTNPKIHDEMLEVIKPFQHVGL